MDQITAHMITRPESYTVFAYFATPRVSEYLDDRDNKSNFTRYQSLLMTCGCFEERSSHYPVLMHCYMLEAPGLVSRQVLDRISA